MIDFTRRSTNRDRLCTTEYKSRQIIRDGVRVSIEFNKKSADFKIRGGYIFDIDERYVVADEMKTRKS